MKIENVVLGGEDSYQCFDIEYSKGRIEAKTKAPKQVSSPSSLVLPTLCHPHIHLDKAYLLTSHAKSDKSNGYPDYSDLTLETGGFKEALAKTAEAKTRYTVPDLILRGSQLVVESIRTGVTSMRAFVEIDHVTQFKCLDAAIEIKRKFNHLCYIQICAFAQDPVMSTEHGEENRRLMEEALEKYHGHIEALGATPYVEENTTYGAENVRWAIGKAIAKSLHLDFHLDFSDSTESEPLVWKVLELLKEAKWTERASAGKRVALGHCTRIALFDQQQMKKLAREIGGLPVAFVGLPTSDMFMMGRPNDSQYGYGRRERGTLQVIDMINKDELQACISVNNVGNAFTPWGSVDPLYLASLAVGVYHAGTAEDASTLYECVSTRARHAIGLQQSPATNVRSDEALAEGMLLIENEQHMQCPDLDDHVPARRWLSVKDVVWDPPERRLRRVIRREIA